MLCPVGAVTPISPCGESPERDPDTQARMATCPRCKGHLTDNHRCPRRIGRTVAEIVASAILGGLVALLAVALIDPQGRLTHVDSVIVTVGIFAGIGLDRLVRSW
jgi:uncharacterized paraquat-inducible protein A